MTYRDDNDALRAKVQQLETALAERRPAIQLGPPARTYHSWCYREELVPFEVCDEGLRGIAATLVERHSLEVVREGGALRVPDRFWLEPCDRGTRIRIASPRPDLGGAAARGGFTALVMPGLPAMALLGAAGEHGMHAIALQALWVIPAIVLAGGSLMRRLAMRHVAAMEGENASIIATVLEIAHAHVECPRPTRRTSSASLSDGEA